MKIALRIESATLAPLLEANMKSDDMRYAIDWKEKLSIVEFSGDVSIEDVEQANKTIHGDNRTYETEASIWDFSKCSLKNIRANDLFYTVAVDIGSSITLDKFKLVFIVEEPHGVEIVKHYIEDCKKEGSPWEFTIVSSRDDAFKWAMA